MTKRNPNIKRNYSRRQTSLKRQEPYESNLDNPTPEIDFLSRLEGISSQPTDSPLTGGAKERPPTS